MSFSAKLRSLRKSCKIGIRELSKRLQYDRAYLNRVENGTVPPSDELIKATAKFFRVPERELRFAAGKFPKDVLDILSNHPTEAVSVLRESLGIYHTNGDLFTGPTETNGQAPRGAHFVGGEYLDQIIQGDCLQVLTQLPPASVDFIVTSPLMLTIDAGRMRVSRQSGMSHGSFPSRSSSSEFSSPKDCSC